MNAIVSSSNNNIKYLLKLKMRKYRELNKEYILEGFKLVDEAIKSKENIRQIFISSHIVSQGKEKIQFYEDLQIPIFEVEDSLFRKLSFMENAQGIMAINTFNENKALVDSNVLLLDRVQDPGNLGTMIRTGDAAGFHNIICSNGSVDIYNEKTIRATMGSLFHVNVKKDVDLLYEIEILKEEGYIVVGSELNTDHYYTSLDQQNKYAIVIGNEANGISEDILNVCDKRIKIPIYGQAESLNASVAAGILMYHIANLKLKV